MYDSIHVSFHSSTASTNRRRQNSQIMPTKSCLGYNMSNSSAQNRLIAVTEKTTSKQKIDESTELGKLKLEYTLLKATKTRVRNKQLKLRKLKKIRTS